MVGGAEGAFDEGFVQNLVQCGGFGIWMKENVGVCVDKTWEDDKVREVDVVLGKGGGNR